VRADVEDSPISTATGRLRVGTRTATAGSARCRQVLPLCALAAFTAIPGGAATAPAVPAQPQGVEEIVVFGRSLDRHGVAQAASEGAVGGADLVVRPMLRVAELLEAVPGMVAVQHSGSGKANQYFLRGFNLDHGTDFTTYVDGVPWNLRSHGHGQGYLDVNGLVPEVVERIDYRKGPYRADTGDFAMAGASFISTIPRLPAPFASVEAGDDHWTRLAAGGTADLAGDGALTGIVERRTGDGPWELEESLRHVALWSKYTRPTAAGTLTATLSGYDARWRPTEQIPERAIGTAACEDPFCTLDPTPRGRTTRWIAGTTLEGAAWRASGYAQFYDWAMQSNPTLDFQINQFDRRWTFGGSYAHTLVDDARIGIVGGAEFRHDDIRDVGVDAFDAGRRVAGIGRNAIDETSAAAYGEARWSPLAGLRLLAGLRADSYAFDVDARAPGSADGSRTDSRLSPKAGVAWAATDALELYANWGRGFHSNDARGVVDATSPVAGMAPGTGYEGGLRAGIGPLTLTASQWWLELDSELIFVGDSNSVEPRGASRRRGYEFTLFWQPLDWLGIDAVYTGSRARYRANPEGRHVEQSVENAGQFGIAATRGAFEASLRIRHLGEYALTPDNAQRADTHTTVNARGAWSLGRFTVYAEVLNLLDDDGQDIVYWYEAYVPGVDPPGQTSADIDCAVADCRVSRAEEPRTVRAGVRIRLH
jgi:outer membrane receptor protein involved in Fe transport